MHVMEQPETHCISLPIEAINMNYILGQTIKIDDKAWTVKSVGLSATDSSMLVLQLRPAQDRRKRVPAQEVKH